MQKSVYEVLKARLEREVFQGTTQHTCDTLVFLLQDMHEAGHIGATDYDSLRDILRKSGF